LRGLKGKAQNKGKERGDRLGTPTKHQAHRGTVRGKKIWGERKEEKKENGSHRSVRAQRAGKIGGNEKPNKERLGYRTN